MCVAGPAADTSGATKLTFKLDLIFRAIRTAKPQQLRPCLGERMRGKLRDAVHNFRESQATSGLVLVLPQIPVQARWIAQQLPMGSVLRRFALVQHLEARKERGEKKKSVGGFWGEKWGEKRVGR